MRGMLFCETEKLLDMNLGFAILGCIMQNDDMYRM